MLPHDFVRSTIALLATAIAVPLFAIQASVSAGSAPPAQSTTVGQAAPQPSPIQRAPQPIMRNPHKRPPMHPPTGPGGGSDQPEQFTALSFIVKTGDDDLRTYSNAWIDFIFADQSRLRCVLKEKLRDGWGNGSTHDEDIPVCVLPSPMTLDQIKSAQIILNYHSFDTDFETDDNWNVDSVHIDAINSATHSQTCVIDEAGDPLVRLKNVFHVWDFFADQPSGSFDLGHHPNAC
jgi:hypothetical protein